MTDTVPSSSRVLFMRFLPLLILALLPITVLAQGQVPQPTPPQVVQASTLTEHVMGDPAAKVTITEYASLTCSHCAHFSQEILPKLQEKYIATGKVKLIYRDYPLDALAFRAAMLAQCMPEERYFTFIKTLFANQTAWVSSANPDATVVQYAKLAGLSDDRVNACLGDKGLQAALVQRRMEAENKYKVTATPSFVINYGQETISGATNFEEFEKQIKKYVGF
jgi:protein-disulfide isomerase